MVFESVKHGFSTRRLEEMSWRRKRLKDQHQRNHHQRKFPQKKNRLLRLLLLLVRWGLRTTSRYPQPSTVRTTSLLRCSRGLRVRRKRLGLHLQTPEKLVASVRVLKFQCFFLQGVPSKRWSWFGNKAQSKLMHVFSRVQIVTCVRFGIDFPEIK